jgi:hypothetical protein
MTDVHSSRALILAYSDLEQKNRERGSYSIMYAFNTSNLRLFYHHTCTSLYQSHKKIFKNMVILSLVFSLEGGGHGGGVYNSKRNTKYSIQIACKREHNKG